jgi:hypothetical protein
VKGICYAIEFDTEYMRAPAYSTGLIRADVYKFTGTNCHGLRLVHGRIDGRWYVFDDNSTGFHDESTATQGIFEPLIYYPAAINHENIDSIKHDSNWWRDIINANLTDAMRQINDIRNIPVPRMQESYNIPVRERYELDLNRQLTVKWSYNASANTTNVSLERKYNNFDDSTHIGTQLFESYRDNKLNFCVFPGSYIKMSVKNESGSTVQENYALECIRFENGALALRLIDSDVVIAISYDKSSKAFRTDVLNHPMEIISVDIFMYIIDGMGGNDTSYPENVCETVNVLRDISYVSDLHNFDVLRYDNGTYRAFINNNVYNPFSQTTNFSSGLSGATRLYSMSNVVAVYRRAKGIHVPGYVGMAEYNRAQQRITQLETQLANMNDVIATMQSTIEELAARIPETNE